MVKRQGTGKEKKRRGKARGHGSRQNRRAPLIHHRQTAVLLVPVLLALSAAVTPGRPAAEKPYRWSSSPITSTISSRFPPPRGYTRVPGAPGSFGAWLRGLPLKEGRGQVRLCTGALKSNQTVHCAVIDIDTGRRNLQQCADAVIRLRAEYLFGAGCEEEIEFRFTSGDVCRWRDYRRGVRPEIRGNRVSWAERAEPDWSYASFRRYLDLVFTYAGTNSLERDLMRVPDHAGVEPGDVFNQAGGHAVIVVDVAADERGRRVFLLAQSYMPAQDIHILANPGNPTHPWYSVDPDGPLVTPEWTFGNGHLRRFPPAECGE